MQEDELALAAQMANVIARFEERCGRIEHRQNELADRIPALIEARIDRWLQTCAGQVETTVRDGFAPSVASFRQTIEAAGADATRTVRALDTVTADFARQRRRTLWALGATLAACAVSLLATWELLYGFYQARYDTLMSQVTYLDAVNRSDIVPCGTGRLCARIDDTAPGVGDKQQYRLIELRP